MKSLTLVSAIACCLVGVALGSMVGGKRPLTDDDVRSSEFRGALDMSTLEMNRLSNHPRFHTVFNFIQGTQQLVAGVLYEFSVIFRATSCENHEAQNLENLAKCTPVNLLGASEFHCSFKVLYQPWAVNAEYRMVSEPSCMSPREMPFAGQKVPLTPEESSSPMFQGAMTIAAVEFNRQSQLSRLHSLVRYDHATKQVVAGMLFEFYGLFIETVCANVPENHGKGIEECSASNSAKTYSCRFEVLFKAWTTPQYTIINERECTERI